VTDTVIGDADGLYRPGSFNYQLRSMFVEEAPGGYVRSSTPCESSASPAKP
jgi:hypothetical protein